MRKKREREEFKIEGAESRWWKVAGRAEEAGLRQRVTHGTALKTWKKSGVRKDVEEQRAAV